MLLIGILSLIVPLSFINSYPLQFDHNAPADIFEMNKKMALKQKTLSRGYAKDLLESQKWTNGIVPYTIDASYSAAAVSIINSGMRLIEDSTRIGGKDCIKFVGRTTETTYLRIFSDTGCWSYIGKVFTGAQQLSLKMPTAASSGSCLFTGTVAHELIHALGFDHEHVRPDRNNFVTINWDKIRADATSNFQIVSNGLDLGFEYDYDSIMHYESTAFSIDGSPTIEPLQSGVQLINKFNQTYLTATDIGEIREFYGCSSSAIKNVIDLATIFFILATHFLKKNSRNF
ncbi:hypothetical protein BpHYR1_032148 [Brachionus plicatilis]|uniref:Metalloendopeptidase n=1 Tax=Brachionus plicatilis TaxID=10195 RepID=A0A3M7Q8Y1_BRAPC|nr:hypothetical protein BpHYR1_032148 [Brachionus plicatilis]